MWNLYNSKKLFEMFKWTFGVMNIARKFLENEFICTLSHFKIFTFVPLLGSADLRLPAKAR